MTNAFSKQYKTQNLDYITLCRFVSESAKPTCSPHSSPYTTPNIFAVLQMPRPTVAEVGWAGTWPPLLNAHPWPGTPLNSEAVRRIELKNLPNTRDPKLCEYLSLGLGGSRLYRSTHLYSIADSGPRDSFGCEHHISS